MAQSRLQRSLKVVFLGMAVNAVLTAGKFTAGLFGHSHALMADAAESAADILSSIIVWRGLSVAAEPADSDHPYGHGKAEPLAAAIVALMLLFAALTIIARSTLGLYEDRVAPKAFTLYILVAVIVIKDFLFRRVSREAEAQQNIALFNDAWHHRSDAITSMAAAVGIGAALIGGPKFAWADDAAAIVAGAIIAWNGWRLLQPAMNELMDGAAPVTLIQQIESAARQTAGVKGVEKCMVRKMGFQYFVDMHVEVDPLITVRDGHQIAHHVKDQVRAAVPSVSDVLVHIEPTE